MTAPSSAARSVTLPSIPYPSKEARNAALQTGMKDGMAESFDRLAEHLRTVA